MAFRFNFWHFPDMINLFLSIMKIIWILPYSIYLKCMYSDSNVSAVQSYAATASTGRIYLRRPRGLPPLIYVRLPLRPLQPSITENSSVAYASALVFLVFVSGEDLFFLLACEFRSTFFQLSLATIALLLHWENYISISFHIEWVSRPKKNSGAGVVGFINCIRYTNTKYQ